MKKILFSALILSAFFMACKKSEPPVNEPPVIRSADPCNAWARPSWQTGPGAVITPELRDGRASHLTPAEIIYYSVIENSDSMGKIGGIFINPVLIITYLENAQLLTKGKEHGDFELRLLEACGFGDTTMKKYHGFYPQLVAATYQWRIYQNKGLTFDEAQSLYTFNPPTPFAEAQLLYPFNFETPFSEAYAQYAKIMNDILKTNFSLYPSSLGYLQDFYGLVMIKDIQLLLKQTNSPLQEDIFKQAPVAATVVNYLNLGDYCE